MHIAFCGFFDWAEPMDIGGWVVSDHYMWGVFGSIIVEVGAVVRATSNSDGRCPPPYNRPFYVFVRAFRNSGRAPPDRFERQQCTHGILSRCKRALGCWTCDFRRRATEDEENAGSFISRDSSWLAATSSASRRAIETAPLGRRAALAAAIRRLRMGHCC